ncbi:MAG: N4-gp56 family major capsid protein, partial [Angelakisella sp.]
MAEVNVTTLANLVDPEIMADLIRQKLTARLRFAPLAKVDSSFVGRPGDTIKLPKYAYIGDATEVPEGTDIPIAQLTAASAPVSIKKAGKGVKLTDEAVLGGYGDPLGEAAAQLTTAIAAKVDSDCMAALNGIAPSMTVTKDTVPLSGDVISEALVKFGEDIDGEKVLLIAPAQLAQLRKSPGYINASELSTQMMMSGTVGELWGCQLVVSNKIVPVTGKYTNYIVKPEALAIYLKKDVELETDRDIEYKQTVVTADQHYAAYLLDESKAIKLV